MTPSGPVTKGIETIPKPRTKNDDTTRDRLENLSVSWFKKDAVRAPERARAAMITPMSNGPEPKVEARKDGM